MGTSSATLPDATSQIRPFPGEQPARRIKEVCRPRIFPGRNSARPVEPDPRPTRVRRLPRAGVEAFCRVRRRPARPSARVAIVRVGTEIPQADVPSPFPRSGLANSIDCPPRTPRTPLTDGGQVRLSVTRLDSLDLMPGLAVHRERAAPSWVKQPPRVHEAPHPWGGRRP